jgi:hypothetical protein
LTFAASSRYFKQNFSRRRGVNREVSLAHKRFATLEKAREIIKAKTAK